MVLKCMKYTRKQCYGYVMIELLKKTVNCLISLGIINLKSSIFFICDGCQ